MQNWDLDSILFLENLKSKTVVNIVLENDPIITNSQDLMTIIQLAAWSKLWIQKSVVNKELTTEYVFDHYELIQTISLDILYDLELFSIIDTSYVISRLLLSGL